VNKENTSGDNITPCTVTGFGETEDYLVNITGGAVNIPCPGATFNLSSTATNGGSPYTYAWTVLSGSATLSAANIANPTAVVNTDATFELTVTDVCGSAVTSTVIADINENPITITPANSVICINDSTTLTAANGSNYTWTPTNGLSASNTAVVVASPTSTETYTVNGAYGIGCIGSVNATVTVNPLPNVNAGLDQTICLNTSIVLNGSGAATYAWNNNVSNGVAFTPDSTATYTVTGTDANGCVNQDQVSITVNGLPVINAGLDQTVCAGSAIVLNGSGSFNGYTWNNGVNNGQNFIPTATANYIVIGIGSNGCANQDTVLVTVNNTPVITIASGGTSVCQNGVLSLTATTQNAFSGFWQTNNGNGVFSPNITNSSVNYQTSNNDPSTVNFSYVAFNQCGATTENTSVSILPIPTLAAGPDLMVCENESVTLNASSNGTVSWSNGVLNNTPFNATLGSASYTATAVGSNGCVVSDQVNITGMPLPNIQAGNDQSICLGNSIILNANGGISYTWNNGVLNNVPFAPTATAVYAVTGFGTNGCSQLDNVSVTVNPVPAASINLSGSVVLTASPTGMSYQWINCGTGQEIADATGASYTATYNGSYAVIVTNANGCSDTSNCEIVNAVGLSDVAAATVGVYPNPTTGQVTIEYPGQDLSSVQIYDAQGKLLMNYPQFKSGEAIQLERFATGVYTIIIENNVIQHIERLVKP
jgi:trimeric autotransporter adhesin